VYGRDFVRGVILVGVLKLFIDRNLDEATLKSSSINFGPRASPVGTSRQKCDYFIDRRPLSRETFSIRDQSGEMVRHALVNRRAILRVSLYLKGELFHRQSNFSDRFCSLAI
jgi:hypothetical protein